jgi:hypothetical protein
MRGEQWRESANDRFREPDKNSHDAAFGTMFIIEASAQKNYWFGYFIHNF